MEFFINLCFETGLLKFILFVVCTNYWDARLHDAQWPGLANVPALAFRQPKFNTKVH
jgi:hypothetical protein